MIHCPRCQQVHKSLPQCFKSHNYDAVISARYCYQRKLIQKDTRHMRLLQASGTDLKTKDKVEIVVRRSVYYWGTLLISRSITLAMLTFIFATDHGKNTVCIMKIRTAKTCCFNMHFNVTKFRSSLCSPMRVTKQQLASPRYIINN